MSEFDHQNAEEEEEGGGVDMDQMMASATAANVSDDMLKINSSFFSKAQWDFLEEDKSSSELFQKLAEYGVKVREEPENILVPFGEEEYACMRKHLIEKLGSPGDKCFPDPATLEDGKKGSGTGSEKDKKGGKKGAGGKKEVIKKADLIKRENLMKLIKDDVDKMSVNRDLSLPHLRNWFQPISLLVHVMQWAVHIILSLRDKYKDPSSGKLVSVSSKIAIDCAMSLYRASKDLAPIAPPRLLFDVNFIAEKLLKSLRSKCGDDLISLISMSYPELISETSYDGIKPYGIALYGEQQDVLRRIDASLRAAKPLLIGYRVPPSGGKTVLSVAIAAMLGHHYRNQKKLLYVCYNTLVRFAVANACTQAGTIHGNPL